MYSKTKYIITLILIFSSLIIIGCNKTSEEEDIILPENYLYNNKLTSKEKKDLKSIIVSLAIEETDCDKYELDKYTIPLWDTQVVYNESVYPLENEDGSISPIRLMYDAACILSVRDSSLKKQYTKGVDYDLEDGKIVILKTGSIPSVKYKDYWLDAPINGGSFPRTGGGHIAYGQGEPFLSKQLAITYIHLDKWDGSVPSSKGNLLPKTIAKLKNKEDLKIVFYGDSIAEGCNTSSFHNVEPFAEDWCSMVTSALKAKYGYEQITMANDSVGGMDSAWGYNNCDTVAKRNPDLVVIAFGMNDGTARVSPTNYQRNIKMTIKRIRKTNENCEFIVVGTMLANKDVAGFAGYQEDYLPELLALEEEGTAVADLTSIHKYLITKKRYFDMTGNNVNHPNDFFARFYAQVILQTVSD